MTPFRLPLPVLLAAPLLAMPLAGCISTVGKVVTAPVHVAGKAVDWTTTSQSEADRNRGRRDRKNDEKRAKLDKQYQRHLRECQQDIEKSCNQARDDYAAIQAITPGTAPPPR